MLEDLGCDPRDVTGHSLRELKVDKYVNLITCDEKYAHRLYDDDSLKFVWIDGDHGPDVVYNHLVNFWPKLKIGGVIGGVTGPLNIQNKKTLEDIERTSRTEQSELPVNLGEEIIEEVETDIPTPTVPERTEETISKEEIKTVQDEAKIDSEKSFLLLILDFVHL